MKRLALALLLLAAPAFAQQQKLTPEQNAAATLGSQLGLCFQGNAVLQTEIDKLQAELKALKDKYEKPAPP